MSGRHGRSTPDAQEDQQTADDVEAIDTATVIAGLRWRLRRQETLEHSRVLDELRLLEEQVTAQLGQGKNTGGRHRAVAAQAVSEQIADAAGFDLKPDPLRATTPAEFVQALRQYRAWSGNPSWRTMAKRANQAVVHSTLYAAMNSEALPKLDVVKATIIGCGSGEDNLKTEDDLKIFVTAWRCIASGRIRKQANASLLGAST